MTLRELLTRKNVKQCSLAKAIGIDPGNISCYVGGYKRIPKKHVSKICEFLNISKADLQKVIGASHESLKG